MAGSFEQTANSAGPIRSKAKRIVTDAIEPDPNSTGDHEDPIDPFFECLPDSGWNACVGRQGYEENYVDGYMEAAQRLVALVMDEQLAGSRDTLVLPILYNARHGIELALKFFIARLHEIGMLAARHAVNHDIRSHLSHLVDVT